MDPELEANRLNWDERAAVHAASKAYNLQAYIDDPARLSRVVEQDVERLGDLTGLEAIHLQCHIGTDTLSLARLGARVTGLDISPASLDVARKLFADTGTPGDFVESEVCAASDALDGRTYELVYTGVGALCWFPRIAPWAATVAALLRPGGRLFLREHHPVLWMMESEEGDEGRLDVRYPYFETDKPMMFDDNATYTDGDVDFTHTRNYEWNHGLGEILAALLAEGLVLDHIEEYNRVCYQALPHMVEVSPGVYELPGKQRDQVPLMYTLGARKPLE